MNYLFFIPYRKKFRDQVFPVLIPNKYYKKYTNGSFIYRFLSFVGIFRNYLNILISKDEDVIGSLAFRFRYDLSSFSFRWFIYGVAVKEQFRGRGYGNNLMSESMRWCKERKINRIFLKVEPNNHSAINLYKKFGFRIINEKAPDKQLIMLKKL